MSLILGLDISTSVTGVSLLNVDSDEFISTRDIVSLDHIPLSKVKGGLWQKVDCAKEFLMRLKSLHPTVSHVFIEEPLKNFSSGLSSADTIVSLIRFNGIVSYICKELWQVEPTYINASHARKLLGVNVKKTSIVGKNAKEQTFEHVSATELSHVVWEKKKNGQPKDHCRDIVDAYVVSRAGLIENLHFKT